jgi:hypothetical protein
MGGVKRISGLLQRERLASPKLWAFDLGNNWPVTTAQAQLKGLYLLEAAASFRPTAMLLGELELRHRKTLSSILKTQEKLQSELPFVLSNLSATGAKTLPFVRPFLQRNETAIFGYLRPTDRSLSKGLLHTVDTNLLKSWASDIASLSKANISKNETKTHRILLFSGPDSDLEAFAKSGLFSLIISGNNTPMDASPGTAERYDETKLVRKIASTKVFMVPLGGQGVLRGGGLRFEPAKTLTELLQDPQKDEPTFLKKETLISWLGPNSVNEDTLSDLFKRYNSAAKKVFRSEATERAKNLASSPYVGAVACQACHPQAFAVWEKSKHSHAIKTLQDKGKDQDSECVVCHVLAAKDPGGFVSMELSPQFANVQCETCHGPRRQHVIKPTPPGSKNAVAANVCLSCHNSTHSPAFDFAKYWPQIKHGLEK